MTRDPSLIAIWKFHRAPSNLRALHTAEECPDWLAFVPREVWGPDLDEAISAQAGHLALYRFETVAGDTVYTGVGEPNSAVFFGIPELLSSDGANSAAIPHIH